MRALSPLSHKAAQVVAVPAQKSSVVDLRWTFSPLDSLIVSDSSRRDARRLLRLQLGAAKSTFSSSRYHRTSLEGTGELGVLVLLYRLTSRVLLGTSHGLPTIQPMVISFGDGCVCPAWHCKLRTASWLVQTPRVLSISMGRTAHLINRILGPCPWLVVTSGHHRLPSHSLPRRSLLWRWQRSPGHPAHPSSSSP